MLTRGKIIPEELAYAACALDCEGSITLSRSRPKGTWTALTVHISIANTNSNLVNFLKDTFGGNLYAEQPHGLSKKVIFRWKLYSNQATEFLRQVRPYIRIKGDQADLAILLQDRRAFKRLSSAELDNFWQLMKALNRGESPAETKREGAETNQRCDSPTLVETPVS